MKPYLQIGLLASVIMAFGILPPPKSPNQNQKIVEIVPQYIADFSDDTILIGASHNVFVGKVIEQIGNKERGVGPETQFTVEVVENIKGDLQGVVTVNQQGGYKDNILYVVAEDMDSGESSIHHLLAPGSTYLFSTRYNEQENWHTLIPHPAANKLLSNNPSHDAQSIRALTVSDERIVALKNAYPHETLLEADIINNKTLNNFHSLQGRVQN